MISISCECGEKYHTEEQHLGKRIRCSCGRLLEINDPSSISSFADEASTVQSVASPAKTARPEVCPTTRIRQSLKHFVVTLTILLAIAWLSWVAYELKMPSSITNPTVLIKQSGVAEPVSSLKHDSSFASRVESFSCSPESISRPRSSTEIGGKYRGGLGKLKISNGTASDAVAVLLDHLSDLPLRAIFVREGEVGLMTAIPAGVYRLRFQLGTDWLVERRFCQPLTTSEFNEPFAFEERELSEATEYSVYEVTLHTVPGGTAKSHAVPNSAFKLPPPPEDEKVRGTIIIK